MAKRVTLGDIATHCGVSRMSVSEILRSPENRRYSQSTREAVLRTAAEIGYVPNRQAISLRSGKTRVVGLILPWNIPELMDAIEREVIARHRGLMVQFSPLPDRNHELRSLEIVLEHNVDSLIWEPNTVRAFDEAPGLKALGSNLVLLGDNADGFGAPVIAFDYSGGLAQVARHAAEQGYRRVIYLHDHPGHKRLEVYADLRRLEPLELEERVFDPRSKQLDFTADPAVPTLFLCDFDWQGLALLEVAQERSWSLPGDVGIAILGDLLLGNQFRVGEIARVPLTALRRDFSAMAARAVAAVFDGASTDNTEIPMKLYPRGSSLRRP